MKPRDLMIPNPPKTPLDHERAVRKWFILKGDPTLREAAEEIVRLAEIERQYWELIYAVAQKHPDESRHQTALRYIRERETPPTEANAQCCSGDRNA